MKMTFKAFAKNLFGADYRRLRRSIFLCLLLFWGLHIADWKIQIAPFFRYLMPGAFTAGVMWQALGSGDQAAKLQNLFLLPFEDRRFVFSYVAALGAYTIFMKTSMLLAVLFAVSFWNPPEIFGSIACAVSAALMAAAVYSLKKHRYVGILWVCAVVLGIRLSADSLWAFLLFLCGGALAVLRLWKTDAYIFYMENDQKSYRPTGHRRFSVWRYLFRYLGCHKNYLLNTAVLWCIALFAPHFSGQTESPFIAPIGFGILSFNTPVCILLSCDPDSEQAVRFLPGQKRAFCVPYCLFIFLCNMTANALFLCSLQLKSGNVTVLLTLTAVFFALQSAILSVLLEWFFPIRNWKIESDLWHHPRKYVVPAIMLSVGGAAWTFPILLFLLLPLLAIEVAVLLFACCRSSG